jgi:CrcB protein
VSRAAPRLPLLVLGVALGGAVGGVARYGLALAVPADRGEPPLGTLAVNLLGCLALGLVVGRWRHTVWVRPVVGTGVLGGFTTWSALAVETDRLVSGAPALALAYLAVTTLGGLGAVLLGLRLAR